MKIRLGCLVMAVLVVACANKSVTVSYPEKFQGLTQLTLASLTKNVSFTEEINKQICRLGSGKIVDDMVIAIDPGDIRKRYASKMENLCKVHDGSDHEIGEGYWLCKAVAADTEHKKVIPLYLEAYSQKAHDFKSENDQLFKAIDVVSAHTANSGI